MDSSDTRLDCFEHREKTYMTTSALNFDDGLTTFAAGLTVRYTTAMVVWAKLTRSVKASIGGGVGGG